MRGIDELSNLERATKEETSGEMTAEEMLKAIYDVIMGKTDDEEEETEEPGEVVILKLEDTESENEESYVSVEDEEILNKVFEKFKEKFEDEFNFVD